MSTRKGKGEQYFARCYQGKQCFFIVCGWKLVKKGSERMQSFFRVCVCVYNNCNRSRSRVVQGASTQRCRVGWEEKISDLNSRTQFKSTLLLLVPFFYSMLHHVSYQ